MNGFNDWFKGHDWWREDDARERLYDVWVDMLSRGQSPEHIAEVFNTVIGVVRNEYE